MKTLNLKKTILSVAVLTAVLGFTSTTLGAGPQCSSLFSENATAAASTANSGYYATKIKGGDIALTGAVKTKVKSIFEDHGLELTSSNVRDAITEAVEGIQNGSKTTSIAKSGKLAKLATDVLAVLKPTLDKQQALTAHYMFGEAVLRLEAIKMSDYKTEDQAPEVFGAQARLKLNTFNKYVESYIDGTNLYKNIADDVGLISWSDIRSLYANNSWVIGIKDHDMYHLHYSYGHPFYLAVNFHASRSMNDRRYHMISSLWESVDSFRTGMEEGIANYMQEKGLTPQEGMLFLSTATEAQLTAIENQIGKFDSDSYTFSGPSYSKSWRPVAMKTEKGEVITHETYVKELEQYINDNLARMATPAKAKYKNYHRKGAGKTSTVDEDQIAD